jgi:gamma-glutamyl-gamma-aminobutyraldehyde dehydrogenase
MSNLLTHEEYQAIASELSLPLNPYINGKFTAPLSGARMETVNPATGEVLGEMANCNAEDVDFAVTKAREAFDRGGWSRMHPSER